MRWLRHVGTFFYSTWMWAETFTVMPVGLLLALLAAPFLSLKQLNPFLARVMATCLRLSGARLRVIRDPGFDRSQPSVFCMNHVGIMDAHLASWSIPQPFTGLMLAWHFKVPAYGWIMKLAGGIPVHPGSKGRFAEVAAHARDRASKGLGILTFPEGHRTRDGETHAFRRGMFFMARDAGMPVVPLAAHGMYAFNTKGSLRFFRGPITVYVGRQYETAGLSDAEIEALADRVHRVVAEFVRTGIVPETEPDPARAVADTARLAHSV